MGSLGRHEARNPGDGRPAIDWRDKQTQRERGVCIPWPGGLRHAPGGGLGQVSQAVTSVMLTAVLPASLGCQETLSQCAMAATGHNSCHFTDVEMEVREVK